MISQIIDKFAGSFKSAVAHLQESQKWLASRREEFGHKVEDAEQRLKFITSDYEMVAQNVFLKDEVVDKLTRLHSSGFEDFAGQSEDALRERTEATKETMAPYRGLVEKLPAICQLHNSMLSQAQMKKVPVRVDDIKSNLVKTKQYIAEMNALLEQATLFAVGEAKQATAG